MPPRTTLKPKPPPAPVTSVTKVERRGRLVLRLGRVAACRTNRRGWPIATLLLGVGAGFFAIGTAYLVRGSPAPLVAVLLTCMGSAVIGLGAWLLYVAARDGARRHIVYLSGRRLGLGSTPARGRDWRPERKFIRRDRIEGIGSGRGGASVILSLPQLHVYLKDGSRIALLGGRPAAELAWVAHVLSCGMETVAPELPPAPAAAGATGPGGSSVLPYETPADDPNGVKIRRSEDGTLTIVLPSTTDEQVQHIVGHLFLLGILTAIGAALLERLMFRGPGPLSIGGGAVVVLVAGAGARSLLRYVARRGEPSVIAVDGQSVSLTRPAGRKPQRWSRGQVVNVRDGRFNRGSVTCAELVLSGGTSVPIAAGREEWERRRVVAALREALAMWG